MQHSILNSFAYLFAEDSWLGKIIRNGILLTIIDLYLIDLHQISLYMRKCNLITPFNVFQRHGVHKTRSSQFSIKYNECKSRIDGPNFMYSQHIADFNFFSRMLLLFKCIDFQHCDTIFLWY